MSKRPRPKPAPKRYGATPAMLYQTCTDAMLHCDHAHGACECDVPDKNPIVAGTPRQVIINNVVYTVNLAMLTVTPVRVRGRKPGPLHFHTGGYDVTPGNLCTRCNEYRSDNGMCGCPNRTSARRRVRKRS